MLYRFFFYEWWSRWSIGVVPATLGWVKNRGVRWSTMHWIVDLESGGKLKMCWGTSVLQASTGTLGCREVSRSLKCERSPRHTGWRTFCWC